MNELKITIVQANLIWQDADANIENLTNLISTVETTDIIVLPEMFATGFSMNPTVLANESYEKAIAFMKNVAVVSNAVICGSLMYGEKEGYYNRFVWVQPDGEILHYDKRHLFTLTKENQHFNRGEERVIINYKSWKIMPLVCYDLRFPVWSRNHKENPYDVLLYVANWPKKRIVQWSKLLQARAIENSAYVIGVNRIGTDGNGFAYTGQSMSVDYKGEPIILEDNKQECRTFVLNKNELHDYRESFPVLNDGDEFEIRN